MPSENENGPGRARAEAAPTFTNPSGNASEEDASRIPANRLGTGNIGGVR